MEELSSNNVNTVENTKVPVAGIDPEVLPPVEMQNQVFLFDDLHELQDVEPTDMFHASLPLNLLEPQELVELDMSSVLPGPTLKYMIREREISQQEEFTYTGPRSEAPPQPSKPMRDTADASLPTPNALRRNSSSTKTIFKSPKANTVVKPQPE
jgi:hypothetical protein